MDQLTGLMLGAPSSPVELGLSRGSVLLCVWLLRSPSKLTQVFLPGGNPGVNLKSLSHRCHPIMVAFVWELTKETIYLPLGCLQLAG